MAAFPHGGRRSAVGGEVLPRSLIAALAVSVLSLCLFGDSLGVRGSRTLGSVMVEANAVLRDPGTQWMVFLCAGTYLITFAFLRGQLTRTVNGPLKWHRWCLHVRSGAIWLFVFMAAAGTGYGLCYATASHSTHALAVLGGAALGQGAAVWESRKQKAEGGNAGGGTVLVLLFLLAGAAVWRTGGEILFQYRGRERWLGLWDNPNTFGVLMGVGVALAVGWLLRAWRMADGRWQIPNLPQGLISALLLAAAGVMGVGLVESYSRGAWVGAGAGLAYLAWQTRRDRRWQMANGKWSGTVATGSLLVLALWGLRGTPGLVVRRAYSVANANDFSWRNRVAAYEGALAMLAERPWLGVGWNQPERVYDGLYRSAKVEEGMAIQLNDYFMLGMTLGIPALGCFAVYLWLALGRALPIADSRSQMADGRWQMGEGEWMKAVCRAGAVVLAVGFWFDGGLFKLATGAVFWILLELGRGEGEGRRQNEECRRTDARYG